MGKFLNKKTLCHPAEPHYCKNLCRKCYFKARYKRVKIWARCIRCGRTRPKACQGVCHTCYLILRKERIKTKFLENQDNKCAVSGCLTDTSAYSLKDWRLDHDHKCCFGGYHKVCHRGVVCNPCNLALGLVKDSSKYLKGLISYLGDTADVS
jgi:hypothetical protein